MWFHYGRDCFALFPPDVFVSWCVFKQDSRSPSWFGEKRGVFLCSNRQCATGDDMYMVGKMCCLYEPFPPIWCRSLHLIRFLMPKPRSREADRTEKAARELDMTTLSTSFATRTRRGITRKGKSPRRWVLGRLAKGGKQNTPHCRGLNVREVCHQYIDLHFALVAESGKNLSYLWQRGDWYHVLLDNKGQ